MPKKKLPPVPKFAGFGGVLVVIAALTGYRTGGFIRNPFADGDLFWQRRLGEYILANHAIPHALGNDVFSAAGAPWVPQEWLFSIFVAVAFDHSALWVLAVVCGLAAFVALAIAAWRALGAAAGSSATALVAACAALCLSPNFALRAEVWVWPLFAAALLVLDFEGPALWWLVPIAVVWANLHASVMILIPIVWLNAGIHAVTERHISRTRLLVCAAVPIATLCTPLGIALPVYAVQLLHSPLRAYISQWHAISTQSIYVRYGFFPLLVLTLVALFRNVWKTRPFDVALTLALAILSFFATRNIAIFALVAVVPAALAFGPTRVASFFDRLPYRTVVTTSAIVVAVALFGWIGFRVGPPGIAWPGAFGSVQRLAALPGEHRLFCAEYSWCSIALGDPNIRIFLDGRADPYPPEIWAAHGAITHAVPGWQALMDRYDINSVIAWRGGFFESRMQTRAQWQEITDTNDACCVLFVRSGR